MKNTTITHWLLYCRPGFEQDCAQEALRQAMQQKPIIGIEQPAIVADSGYVVVALNEQKLSYRELIFARQLIRLHHTIESLSERDRLTPILAAVAAPAPNIRAISTSRTKARMRESSVRLLMVARTLRRFMLGRGLFAVNAAHHNIAPGTAV